jgi:hypothetical protein
MERALSFTTFSQQTADFLTLALFRQAETIVVIAGFLVSPVSETDQEQNMTEEQKSTINTVEQFLTVLGGIQLNPSLPDRDEIFSYAFEGENARQALLFFANKSQDNPSKEELQLDVETNGLPSGSLSLEDYLNKYSTKTFLELSEMFLPVQKTFTGKIGTILREKENSLNTPVTLLSKAIQVSSNVIALGCQNGNIELWDLNAKTFRPIKLYSTVTPYKEEDKRITKMKLLSSTLAEGTEMGIDQANFIVGTAGGDAFIVFLRGDSYPTIQKLELSDRMSTLCVLSPSRIAIGLVDNTIDIFDLQVNESRLLGSTETSSEFRRILSLNWDNIQIGLALKGIVKLVKRRDKQGDKEGIYLLALSEEKDSYVLREYSFRDSSQDSKESSSFDNGENSTIATIERVINLDSPPVDLAVQGETIVLPSEDGTIRLIGQVDEDLEVKEIASIKKVFNNNENLLLVPSSGSAFLLTNLNELFQVQGTNLYNISVYVFLSDGRLVLGAETGEIELFNKEGKLESQLQSMPSLDIRTAEDKIVSLIYDGNNVISVSEAGEVTVWE